MRQVYQTHVDEDGRRFSLEPLFKGQQPLTDKLVDHVREVARTSKHPPEREKSEQWLREYEEMARG